MMTRRMREHLLIMRLRALGLGEYKGNWGKCIINGEPLTLGESLKGSFFGRLPRFWVLQGRCTEAIVCATYARRF